MIGKLISTLTGVPRWAWIGMAGILAAGALWIVILRGQVSEGRESINALTVALTASEAELEIQREIRSADEVASGVKADTIREVTAKDQEARIILQEALDANEDWANQPVPRAVADSLQP